MRALRFEGGVGEVKRPVDKVRDRIKVLVYRFIALSFYGFFDVRSMM